MKRLIYVFAVVFMVSLLPACSFEQDIDDLTVDLPESEGTGDNDECTHKPGSKK